jgi:hypothetical protein
VDALARVPELLLLTEEGLNLALMRSNRPLAGEFRRWLASEVVPQIARTGRYDPAPARRAPKPSREVAALKRLVGVVLDAGHLDVAIDVLRAAAPLVAPGGIVPQDARVRAGNRLLAALMRSGAFRGRHALFGRLLEMSWSPAEKAVLAVLLDLGADETPVWLTHRGLGARIGMTTRTMSRAVGVLRARGLLRVAPAQLPQGPRSYGVNVDALTAHREGQQP